MERGGRASAQPHAAWRDPAAWRRYAPLVPFVLALLLSAALARLDSWVLDSQGESARAQGRWVIAWTYLALMCLAQWLWIRTYGTRTSIRIAMVLLTATSSVALYHLARMLLLLIGEK